VKTTPSTTPWRAYLAEAAIRLSIVGAVVGAVAWQMLRALDAAG
jgi:hypothetical protein